LRRVDEVFAIGGKAAEALAAFAHVLSIATPDLRGAGGDAINLDRRGS
jgi:gamma-glutamyltranspeptidase